MNTPPESAKTQCERLLAHLKLGLPLTAHKALYGYGCQRLAARMWDLRQVGTRSKSGRWKCRPGTEERRAWRNTGLEVMQHEHLQNLPLRRLRRAHLLHDGRWAGRGVGAGQRGRAWSSEVFCERAS